MPSSRPSARPVRTYGKSPVQAGPGDLTSSLYAGAIPEDRSAPSYMHDSVSDEPSFSASLAERAKTRRRNKSSLSVPLDVIEIDWDSNDEADLLSSRSSSNKANPKPKEKGEPPKKKKKTTKKSQDDDDEAYSSSLYRREAPVAPESVQADSAKTSRPKPRPAYRKRSSPPPPIPPKEPLFLPTQADPKPYIPPEEPLFMPTQADPEPYIPPASQQSLITLPVATSDFGLPPSSIIPLSTPDPQPAHPVPKPRIEVAMPPPPPAPFSDFFAPSSSSGVIPGLGDPGIAQVSSHNEHPSDSGVDLSGDVNAHISANDPKLKKKRRSKADEDDEAAWDGDEKPSTKRKPSAKKGKEKTPKEKASKTKVHVDMPDAADSGSAKPKKTRAKGRGKEKQMFTSKDHIADSDEDGIRDALMSTSTSMSFDVPLDDQSPLTDDEDPLALKPGDDIESKRAPPRLRMQDMPRSDVVQPVMQAAAAASSSMSLKSKDKRSQKRKDMESFDALSDSNASDYESSRRKPSKSGKSNGKTRKKVVLDSEGEDHPTDSKHVNPRASSRRKRSAVEDSDNDIAPAVTDSNPMSTFLPGDDDEELTPTSDLEPAKPHSKENIRPQTPPASQTSRSSGSGGPARPPKSISHAPETPVSLNRPAPMSTAKRSKSVSSPRVTPMSELIRRASAKAAASGSPFTSPAPNGRNYSPFAKSSR
jgi:hypothetical protein